MAENSRASFRKPFRGGLPAKGPSKIRGGPQGPQPTLEKPKRESILDLAMYLNSKVRVKFTGGREVIGVLKGYDQLLNLVLDEVEEKLQEPENGTRLLGLVVLRGPTVTVISPLDGSEEIENPFQAAQ